MSANSFQSALEIPLLSSQRTSTGGRILIVEDDRLLARDVQVRLRQLGYRADWLATSGEDGVRIALEYPVDLVLMDIGLGEGIDGVETVARIHEACDVPVLYLTAHSDDDSLARAKRTNPYGYVLKPAGTAALGVAIEMALHRYDVQKNLASFNASLSMTLASIGDGIIATDLSGAVRFANRAAASLLGVKEEQLLGKNVDEILQVRFKNGLSGSEPPRNPVAEVLASGRKIIRTDVILENRTGSDAPIDLTVALITDDQHQSDGVILAFRETPRAHTDASRAFTDEPAGIRQSIPVHSEAEIGRLNAELHAVSQAFQASSDSNLTDRRRAEEKIHRLTHFHPLTDLPNRDLLRDRLAVGIALLRTSNKELAVLHLNLDRFKALNDSLGQACGDAILKNVAGILSKSIDESCTVAHTAADEFIVAIPDCSRERAVAYAMRLLGEVSDPITVDERVLRLSGCIGVAMYPEDAQDGPALLRCADAALITAKQNGGNAHACYSAEMSSNALARVVMETDLRRALLNDEFVLYYQPQIDSLSGNVVGFEALVRWTHPTAGLLPPGEFIPLAEESGIIFSLGDLVLRKASSSRVDSACARIRRRAGPAW